MGKGAEEEEEERKDEEEDEEMEEDEGMGEEEEDEVVFKELSPTTPMPASEPPPHHHHHKPNHVKKYPNKIPTESAPSLTTMPKDQMDTVNKQYPDKTSARLGAGPVGHPRKSKGKGSVEDKNRIILSPDDKLPKEDDKSDKGKDSDSINKSVPDLSSKKPAPSPRAGSWTSKPGKAGQKTEINEYHKFLTGTITKDMPWVTQNEWNDASVEQRRTILDLAIQREIGDENIFDPANGFDISDLRIQFMRNHPQDLQQSTYLQARPYGSETEALKDDNAPKGINAKAWKDRSRRLGLLRMHDYPKFLKMAKEKNAPSGINQKKWDNSNTNQRLELIRFHTYAILNNPQRRPASNFPHQLSRLSHIGNALMSENPTEYGHMDLRSIDDEREMHRRSNPSASSSKPLSDTSELPIHYPYPQVDDTLRFAHSGATEDGTKKVSYWKSKQRKNGDKMKKGHAIWKYNHNTKRWKRKPSTSDSIKYKKYKHSNFDPRKGPHSTKVFYSDMMKR